MIFTKKHIYVDIEKIATAEFEEKKDDEQNNDDDDDDDDSDYDDDYKEKDDKFIDIVGNIKKKLDKNKLKYVRKDLNPLTADDFTYMHTSRVLLWKMYREFEEIYDIKDGGDGPNMYLHRKRMMVLVDRRHLKRYAVEDVVTDHIWMYEAPENCRYIPAEPVPEWHISASKTCLLPNMNYGKGIDAERGNQIEKQNENDKDRVNKKHEEEARDPNVTSASNCMSRDLLYLLYIRKIKIINYVHSSGININGILCG